MHAPGVLLCRFYPKAGVGDDFLVKNLPAVIHASGTAKKLGTSEQSFKLNQRGMGRRKTAVSHLYASSACTEHGLATGED